MGISRKLGILSFSALLVFTSLACSLGGLLSSRQSPSTDNQPTAAAQSQSEATATSAPDQPAAQPTDTAPAVEATQPVPSLSADGVYKAVADSYAKLAKAGPRHVSQTSYKGDSVATNLELDSVPPNYHQVMKLKGVQVAEQYVYDGDLYNHIQGVWTVVKGGGEAFKNTLQDFGEALSDQIVRADGKVEGIEMVNGKPAILYSWTVTIKDISKEPALHKLWVDPVSGLPVKQETDTKNSKDPSVTDKIIQLITYDPSITITLPDEAKNAQPAQ
jgi:hypothetical protein